MKLYHISQTENTSYDTYDSAVVAAPDEAAARNTHPDTGYQTLEEWKERYPAWATSPDKVVVRYLGEAAEGTEPGVICASFTAG